MFIQVARATTRLPTETMRGENWGNVPLPWAVGMTLNDFAEQIAIALSSVAGALIFGSKSQEDCNAHEGDRSNHATAALRACISNRQSVA